MTLEGGAGLCGLQGILLLVLTQDDVDDVGKRQAVRFGSVLYSEYVVGMLDDAFCEEEAKCQFVVVAGGAHDDGQALLIDAYFKWLFDGEAILLRALLIVLPVSDVDVHYAFRVKWGAPVF